MTTNRNPQADQMADESMMRTLAAQAKAIWPQENFFDRYALPSKANIADIGCGSGEITARLARHFPEAQLIGIDILEGSIAHARAEYAELAPRLRFEQGDAFELQLSDRAFDLVVCRHVTQAVPEPEKVLSELWRICKPDGWIHVLSEDYGMLHFPGGAEELDRLWRGAVRALAQATGVDERIGRRTWSLMRRLGLRELSVEYVTVDTLRVRRNLRLDHWRLA